MPSLLVVSPPTLDYIVSGGTILSRPGGPALYSLFGASMRGWRVYAVGPWGWETLESVAVERELGVERVGYPAAGRGAVFRHEYRSGRRFSEILGRPEGLRVDEFIRALDGVRPDAVLVSPITGEEAGYIASLLAQRSDVKCVGLDIQGYVRGYGDVWEGFLPAARSYVVHMSSDDTGEEGVSKVAEATAGRSLIVYTRGTGPITVVTGSLAEVLPGPRKTVGDPTGAGDIFTSITLAEYCTHGDIVAAVRRAVDLAPEALEEARKTLG